MTVVSAYASQDTSNKTQIIVVTLNFGQIPNTKGLLKMKAQKTLIRLTSVNLHVWLIVSSLVHF